jgi:type I restriction-modification system DNA methylase subunit
MGDEEGEQIDIAKEWKELLEIEKEQDLLRDRVEAYLKQVNNFAKDSREHA